MSEDRKPGHSDEWVPEDDRVIGRAFRWSIAVIVTVLVVGGGVAWFAMRPEPAAAPVEAELVPPQALATEADPPEVRFTDVTAEAGIDFVHVNGATGDKMLPETMGGGVAFLDYDTDGDQDLLFVNSSGWPWDPPRRPAPTLRLYRNDGKGSFEDVTTAAGLAVTLYGMGAAVGDHDNDGDPDVFVTAVGENRLYRNDGGRFVDATAAAGVTGDADRWSSSAGFFDYDNDGDLDLWVCNYIQWSREIDFAVDFKLTGLGRAYGPPTSFEGTHPYLYRNDGGGKFTDVSAEAGIEVTNPATGVPMSKALAIGLADVDGDGFVDVFVANDTVQNFLFRNRGDGTFEESGAVAGVGFDSAGNATGAMGVDVSDFRNEGRLGVAVANFANEMSSLYMPLAPGELQFSDEAIVEGVGSPSRQVLSFGLFFFDYDLDGRFDLLQANGHLEDEINKVQPSQHYEQAAQLFWNAGPAARASFVEVPGETAGDLGKPIVGRGAAYADIDGDGDLDVVLTQTGGPPLLLRNDQDLGHHWLRVKLIGGDGVNRDAIGAWVELTQNGVTRRAQVMPTRSYLSQVELPLTFGLGESETIERLVIRWPDGTERNVTGAFAPDRTLVVGSR